MSPLLMSRDDALALARSLGTRVDLVVDPKSGLPAGLTGTVIGVDILGRVALEDVHSDGVHKIDTVRVAMADVKSWSVAK